MRICLAEQKTIRSTSKHHKEEINVLKADKSDGLGMVIAKFTEREVQRDKVIDNYTSVKQTDAQEKL